MARRINPLFLGIGGVMLIYFGLISCKVVPVFHFKEAFIPKQHIQQDIQALSPLRAVQLLNWPLAKKKLLEKLKKRGLISFKTKYGFILYSSDIYIAY